MQIPQGIFQILCVSDSLSNAVTVTGASAQDSEDQGYERLRGLMWQLQGVQSSRAVHKTDPGCLPARIPLSV